MTRAIKQFDRKFNQKATCNFSHDSNQEVTCALNSKPNRTPEHKINRVINRRSFIATSSLALGVGMLEMLAACGNKPRSAGSGGQSSSQSGSFDLIVGFDEAFPPYGYLDEEGEYTGFDLDLAREVCKKERWNFTPMPISWDAKDALLGSGQISCIWNGFTIEGREDSYAFTDPYMENRQIIVVKADSDIKTLADLANKRVVTQADSAALDLLSEGGAQETLAKTFAKLDTIGEYNTAFMSLEQGSYDAIAVDYPVAMFNINGNDKFTLLDEALNSEHFGVGCALTDEGKRLAATIQKDLQELDDDGTIKKICEKYSDQGVSYDLWCLPQA